MTGSVKPRGIESREASFIAISLTSLRLDTVTNFDIYFQPHPDQPFVLYAEKNIRFTEAVRRRLIENRMSTVYIRAAQRRDYRTYLEANLPAIIADPHVPPEEKADVLYNSASGVVEAVLAKPESPAEIRRSKEMVRHTVDFMVHDKRVFGCMLKTISSVYHVYSHSVNVVTYSVALAQRAGYTDAPLLRELAIGALLHDVGKSKIDPAILDSPESLTHEQWEMMKQHPRYGYHMLNELGSVGEVALDIVLHHHERVQGGGYPDNLAGNNVSQFVRIVAIADTFDALTTERPFQRAKSSYAALALMKTKMSSDLDNNLLRTFVALMGHPTR